MEKTREQLKQYWDNLILQKIPPHAEFHKVEAEIKEHYSYLQAMWLRIVLPLVVFYILLATVLGVHVMGSLFVSMLIFVYSNLLPDVDMFISIPKEGQRESLWYEIGFLLCLAPIYVFYVFQGKANPLYSKKHKPFHGIEAVFWWGIFLLVIGGFFWPDVLLKRLMLAFFGVVGFLFHLAVDGVVKVFKIKKITLE